MIFKKYIKLLKVDAQKFQIGKAFPKEECGCYGTKSVC